MEDVDDWWWLMDYRWIIEELLIVWWVWIIIDEYWPPGMCDFHHKNWVLEDIVNQIRLTKMRYLSNKQDVICQQKYVFTKMGERQDRNEFETTNVNGTNGVLVGVIRHNWNPRIPNAGQNWASYSTGEISMTRYETWIQRPLLSLLCVIVDVDDCFDWWLVLNINHVPSI